MNLPSAPGRLRAALRPRPVPWPTVIAVAALIAYADGFVLTATQGAVGAIERAQSPFASWLLTSTLLLPVYLVAVLAALAFAHRRLGPALRGGRTVAAALVVVAAGTLVGSAAVIGSAFYDYHLQSQQLAHTAHLHAEHQTGAGCTGLCAQLAQTGAADQRGARLASAADLALNAVLVAWVLALRGGRLHSPRLEAACRQTPDPPVSLLNPTDNSPRRWLPIPPGSGMP